MNIRPASTDEAPTLTRISLQAKSFWGYPEHWITHWMDDLSVTPEFIRDNHVYVIEDEGQVKGFYALCVSGDKAELEHMWVTPASIGTGLGKILLLDAMDRAASLAVRTIELSSDPNAAGFYRKMGATQIGETESIVDGTLRKLPRMTIKTN